MVLVDTSVIIGFLKGERGKKELLLEEIFDRKIPYGISAFTYQELLQGARDDDEWETLKDYLSTQKIYYLTQAADTYEKGARLFSDLRRKGVTPRSTIDLLIVLTALEYGLTLLHNDKDFDLIGKYLPELRIMEQI